MVSGFKHSEEASWPSILAKLVPQVRGMSLEHQVEELFGRLRKPVFRYLVSVFGSAAEAEDVTQEAFLRLHRQLAEGKKVENARAWIFRVAHNLAINRQKAGRSLQFMDPPYWDLVLNQRRDPAPTPEHTLLEEERFRRVRAALGRLTPREREVLQCRAEGLQYREIAEVLEMPRSTVADTLIRAIEKIKAEIKAEFDE